VGLTLRLIYAACLLGATINHVRTVAAHGLLWNYGGVSVASATFWTSLTLLDPLAAILLIARPNAGVLATAVIILSDVIHNLWITARYAQPHHLLVAVTSDFFVISQIVFLLFVAATAPIAWTPRERHLASTHR
jgi:hypothetical protein